MRRRPARLTVARCISLSCEIDRWAEAVRKYTKRVFRQFSQRPDRTTGSEGQFRIKAMVTALQRDLGVRYNCRRIDDPADFADSRDAFVHGITHGPGGTCTSLPFLYIAVGRRLGYPLKLVLTRGHFFARWEEPQGERFNIECTNNRGFACHPDEYYLTWPYSIKDKPWQITRLPPVPVAARGGRSRLDEAKSHLVGQRIPGGVGQEHRQGRVPGTRGYIDAQGDAGCAQWMARPRTETLATKAPSHQD